MISIKDGKLADLCVPWCLQGALVHNLVCALCYGRVLHTDLSLKERCEMALSGFVAIDLFVMLATAKCMEMKQPRGSCFMAPQTCQTLQSVALVTALMCHTKPTGFCPWLEGFGRVSELPIEQWFGFLRGQSQNAQLSTRQFFIASARQSVKHSNSLNKSKVGPRKEEQRLTDEECLFLIWDGLAGVDGFLNFE